MAQRESAAACSAAPAPRLSELPAEVIERIMLAVGRPRDLAAANATSRFFRGAPGGRSPVEHALRERARARGHASALPTELPAGVRTWTEELFARDHVCVLAWAHSMPVTVGARLRPFSSFSAFVDAEGGLHTCGEEEVRDEATGRLTGGYAPPKVIGHLDLTAVLGPSRVPSLSAVRVRSVAAGDHHLLALSEAGAVYGCGDNFSGQLGLRDDDQRHAFAHVRALVGEAIVCIAAGGEHSLALTAAGCAYSWGYNYYGQLGHGDRKDRWEPTRIEALDGVRVGGVAAGHTHTLLLSASGAVYSCGLGSWGPLGHGDAEDQHTPRRIEALAGVRAVHVSAGYAHSLVVDAAGSVHSFGWGEHGPLGHGDGVTQRAPKCVEALAGVRAVRASAGFQCSAVLGADGGVHTLGFNGHGQLGHGADGNITLPKRVLAFAHERVVCYAERHSTSLFVSADGSVYACGKRSAALGLGVSRASSMAAGGAGQRDALGLTRLGQLPPVGVGERWACPA